MDLYGVRKMQVRASLILFWRLTINCKNERFSIVRKILIFFPHKEPAVSLLVVIARSVGLVETSKSTSGNHLWLIPTLYQLD